jgi:hypothetical protein
MNRPTKKQIAAVFCFNLRRLIASEYGAQALEPTMRRINRRNEVATKEICHSHDFVDSNVAMMDTLDSFDWPFDSRDASQSILVKEAWDLAKQVKFDADLIPTDASDQAVIDAMARYGGKFVKMLSMAASAADPDNLRRIKIAFPELWSKYSGMALE